METKRRPINNPLVFSSIVLSFAACFVALIHVEIELHAHRKMLQVLTQQREESIHSRGIVNDKSIASALCSDTGKGECFGLVVRFLPALNCCFTMDLFVKTLSIPQHNALNSKIMFLL